MQSASVKMLELHDAQPIYSGNSAGKFEMFNPFNKEKRRNAEIVRKVYDVIVAQGRQPAFYQHVGVTDDVNGRFDLLLLHMWLFARRLGRAGDDAVDRSQQVFDLFVTDMDRSVREMGTSDRKVPKKVKQLISAYYGRMSSYDAAYEDPDPAMFESAIGRNIFPDQDTVSAPAKRLASYARSCEAHLQATPLHLILDGEFEFPMLDTPGQGAETDE